MTTTEVVGWIAGIGIALVGIVVAHRKGMADVREKDVLTDAEGAKAKQKLKHDEESWAVKQSRELYDRVNKQVTDLWEKDRLCQIRLATAETRLVTAVNRIRDLEKYAGIKSKDDDSWMQDDARSQDHDPHTRPSH